MDTTTAPALDAARQPRGEAFAAFDGRVLDRLENLLAGGIDPDVRDNDGRTLLMAAARAGHESDLALLLICGASVDLQDPDGRTALMFAAINGHAGAAAILLNHGADARLRDDAGDDALTLAALNRHAETADVIRCGQS